MRWTKLINISSGQVTVGTIYIPNAIWSRTAASQTGGPHMKTITYCNNTTLMSVTSNRPGAGLGSGVDSRSVNLPTITLLAPSKVRIMDLLSVS